MCRGGNIHHIHKYITYLHLHVFLCVLCVIFLMWCDYILEIKIACYKNCSPWQYTVFVLCFRGWWRLRPVWLSRWSRRTQRSTRDVYPWPCHGLVGSVRLISLVSINLKRTPKVKVKANDVTLYAIFITWCMFSHALVFDNLEYPTSQFSYSFH
jgi:hypothetical protein